MEENEHLLELISHVTEDSLGIEDNKKHINITEQTLKDCITLETLTNDNSDDNFAEAFISEIIWLKEQPHQCFQNKGKTYLGKQVN